MAEFQPGDQVLYVPQREAHGLDADHQGDHCFAFEHVADPKDQIQRALHVQHGAPADPKKVGRWLKREADGSVRTEAGHRVAPAAPRYYWPGVVREVFDDGTALVDVKHPSGCYTLHYRLKHDAAKGDHTFHHRGAE